ncbi:hypothetical protein E2562_024711 [Oryza meyeriana var. granulata]|uniref:Uncharacterized protein n=1 Tax=Oryza meyeriana var. granulata TaxID=110450 RepID=A0A6G1D7B0_9ORYZ|nr:hypothetical protein E2562_024711 [Oryza meyeriana var. granulata]
MEEVREHAAADHFVEEEGFGSRDIILGGHVDQGLRSDDLHALQEDGYGGRNIVYAFALAATTTTGALIATTSSGLTPMTGLGKTTASRSCLQTAGSQLYRRSELNGDVSNEALLRLPPDTPWMLARCLSRCPSHGAAF